MVQGGIRAGLKIISEKEGRTQPDAISRLSRMPNVIRAAYVGALSLHFLNNRVVERNIFVRPFLGGGFFVGRIFPMYFQFRTT